jgi:small multidrug resistance family-3 protein
MLGAMQNLAIFGFLLLATTLEATGDAVIRNALHTSALFARIGLFAVGATLVFGYGVSLNLAPTQFHRVVGLYIATLFVVWQAVNFIAFRTLPTPPMLIGGAFIVVGGLIVTFWPHGSENT